MTLVEIIRHCLEHAELSQPAAARRAGISPVTVEKWLAGTMPLAEGLIRFIRACGVNEKILAKWEIPEAVKDA